MAIRFDHKPGLVIYLTAGDPSLDATREIALAAIDAGADVIELGVPFSDPLADGPVIQRASERAVARGTRLKDVLELHQNISDLYLGKTSRYTENLLPKSTKCQGTTSVVPIKPEKRCGL